MEYRFKPRGVCSQEMIIELDGDIIKNVKIIGGCAGNTVGVSRLIQGMKNSNQVINVYYVNYSNISK